MINQTHFTLSFPLKALAFTEVKLLLRARRRGTTHDLDKVGTPHFAVRAA